MPESELTAVRAREVVDAGATARDVCGRAAYVVVLSAERVYFGAE